MQPSFTPSSAPSVDPITLAEPDDAPIQAWLEAFLAALGALAGTVHAVDAAGETLHLRAAVNIPPPIRDVVRAVPRGKGMAGLVLERRAPVATSSVGQCEEGVVKPGARSVTTGAAVTLPVWSADGRVRAVVGVGYATPRPIDEALLASLQGDVVSLPTLG